MQKCSNQSTQLSKGCVGAKENRICSDGVNYVQSELGLTPKKAIISCEGGCIKGEIARVATNILAYRLQRNEAVRICLGDAATGDSGFVELVKRSPNVIAIEGCSLQCGTEILKKRLPELVTTVINASELYEFDRSKYFEIFDMPRPEIEEYAQKVAEYVQKSFFITE